MSTEKDLKQSCFTVSQKMGLCAAAHIHGPELPSVMLMFT